MCREAARVRLGQRPFGGPAALHQLTAGLLGGPDRRPGLSAFRFRGGQPFDGRRGLLPLRGQGPYSVGRRREGVDCGRPVHRLGLECGEHVAHAAVAVLAGGAPPEGVHEPAPIGPLTEPRRDHRPGALTVDLSGRGPEVVEVTGPRPPLRPDGGRARDLGGDVLDGPVVGRGHDDLEAGQAGARRDDRVLPRARGPGAGLRVAEGILRAGQLGQAQCPLDDDRGDHVPQHRGLAGARWAVDGEEATSAAELFHDLVHRELLAEDQRTAAVGRPPAQRDTLRLAARPHRLRLLAHVDPLPGGVLPATGQVGQQARPGVAPVQRPGHPRQVLGAEAVQERGFRCLAGARGRYLVAAHPDVAGAKDLPHTEPGRQLGGETLQNLAGERPGLQPGRRDRRFPAAGRGIGGGLPHARGQQPDAAAQAGPGHQGQPVAEVEHVLVEPGQPVAGTPAAGAKPADGPGTRGQHRGLLDQQPIRVDRAPEQRGLIANGFPLAGRIVVAELFHERPRHPLDVVDAGEDLVPPHLPRRDHSGGQL